MFKPMPTALAVALSHCAVLTAAPAFAAGDADIAEIRQQLQQMKEAYEQRIVSLERKLAKAEGVAAKAEETAREAENTARQANLRAPAASATSPANSFNPEVSRNISVDIRYLLWMLRDVAGADALLQELQPRMLHSSPRRDARVERDAER